MGRAAPLNVTWIGHSTVLIELDGVRLLTDPLLRANVAHLRRVAPPIATEIGRLDGVLVSHGHYDHLDVPSLRKIDPAVPVVAPAGAGPALRRARRENVIPVASGEEVELGELSVRATPAEHAGGAGLRKGEAVGFLVQGSATVYFAGDTDLFDEMADLGPVDLALVPVWGWGPGLGAGHLDPERAAEAVALIEPKIAVPIHWGTYRPLHVRRGSFLTEPPLDFRRAAAEVVPATRVEILQPGETLAVSAAALAR